jgi:hypothetical protein
MSGMETFIEISANVARRFISRRRDISKERDILGAFSFSRYVAKNAADTSFE